MQSPKDKVVIDTNLWVSFLLSKNFKKLDSLIFGKQIKLLFSHELIEEIVEVTQRKKFRKYFPLDEVETLLEKIRNQAIFITPTTVITLCRDEHDNFLLALAVDGLATHLITGDKDLLILEKIGDTKILTITEYLESNPSPK